MDQQNETFRLKMSSFLVVAKVNMKEIQNVVSSLLSSFQTISKSFGAEIGKASEGVCTSQSSFYCRIVCDIEHECCRMHVSHFSLLGMNLRSHIRMLGQIILYEQKKKL